MITQSTGPEQQQIQQIRQEHHWPEDMGRSLKQWAVICATLGALAASALGCASPAHNPDGSVKEGWTDKYFGVIVPTHTQQVSENLWVIPAGNSAYVDSLTTFMKTHPDLKVIDSDIGAQGKDGYAYYHVVITEPSGK